jgi:hypothetical protein
VDDSFLMGSYYYQSRKMISMNFRSIYMKKLAMVMAALMLMATSAYAKKDCTTEPKDKWTKFLGVVDYIDLSMKTEKR